jgi:hypothetical protein
MFTAAMGNNMSTPSDEHSETPRKTIKSTIGSIHPRPTTTTISKNFHTTPRSIDVLQAVANATMALRPAETGNSSSPERLAKTLTIRKADRSAFTFFACGRNIFIHYGGMALLDRKVITSKPGTKEFEQAAEKVWIEVAMHDLQQRRVWESAAKQAKAALTSETVSAEELLKDHGLPSHKAEYQAWAAGAVEEFLARHAAGTLFDNDDASFVLQAATNAASDNNKSETRESTATAPPAAEREMVSAINLRDLAPQHFVGVEPSIREVDLSSVRSASPPPAPEGSYPFPTSGPVEVVDAVATTRLYLDLNMTPPRGSTRSSICSIASSLAFDLDSVAEIVTTEVVTPVKARIVDL